MKNISLSISNHCKDERILEKNNSKLRLPPNFNKTVFKKIISQFNPSKFLDNYIVVFFNYKEQENIFFLFKIENVDDKLSIILISSLITKNSLFPYQKVDINNRICLDVSYFDLLLDIEKERLLKKELTKNSESIFRSRSIDNNTSKPLITGLKIIKKKDSNV